MTAIYHLARGETWRAAQAAGVYRGEPADRAQGFLHFSPADAAMESAALHFPGADDLILLAVDAAALGTDLRWEMSRGGKPFPHLYAALRTATVAWAVPLPLGADGRHVFPPLSGMIEA